MSDFYVPESAMAIYAHPDDIEFACAGSMARWAIAGARISYIIITNGDVGIADPDISKEEVVRIRQEESRAAANIAGATEVVFMGEHDGMLQPTMDLRKRLVREIRRFKPEVIITGDPTAVFVSDSYINHPDHRAAATVAIDAIFPAAGQPNLFEEIEHEEGFSAFKPRHLYVSTWDEVTHYVNIEDTINTKVKALQAHVSQMQDWDPETHIKDWAADRANGKEMKYAEAFRVITLVDEEDWEICQGDPLKLDAHRKKEREEKLKEAA